MLIIAIIFGVLTAVFSCIYLFTKYCTGVEGAVLGWFKACALASALIFAIALLLGLY